jgi:hypothetical protein
MLTLMDVRRLKTDLELTRLLIDATLATVVLRWELKTSVTPEEATAIESAWLRYLADAAAALDSARRLVELGQRGKGTVQHA